MNYKKYKYPIILFLIAAFHFINNYIWLSKDSVSLAQDVVAHLSNQTVFFCWLKAIFTGEHPWVDILRNFSSLFIIDTPGLPWPKFVYFYSSLFNLVFGRTTFVTMMSNMPFFIILLISVYLIGKKCESKNAGLLSAFILSLYPAIYGPSRSYGLDFPLTAMVSLCIYFLLCSEGFKNIKYSLFFGISLGVGCLVKLQIIFFLIGPLLCVVYSGFIKEIIFQIRHRNVLSKKEKACFLKSIKKKIIGLLFFLLCAGLIALFFWFDSIGYFLKKFFCINYFSSYQPIIAQCYGSMSSSEPLSMRWFLYYFYALIDNISPFFFLVFFPGLFFFARSKFKNKSVLLYWFGIPYVIFTFIVFIKTGRFYFPVLPVAALVSGSALLRIRHETSRVVLISAILILGSIQFFHTSYDLKPEPASLELIREKNYQIFPHRNDWAHPPDINNCEEITDIFVDEIKKRNQKDESIKIGVVKKDFWNGYWWPDYCYRIAYYMRLRDVNIEMYDIKGFKSFWKNRDSFDYLIVMGDSDLIFPSYQGIDFYLSSDPAVPFLLDRSEIKEIRKEWKGTVDNFKKFRLLRKETFQPIGLNVYLLEKPWQIKKD